MKTVHAPHLGQSVVLGGRKRPVTSGLAPRLSALLRASDLPTPPDTTALWTPVADVAMRNIYLNNVRGCCVIAGRYHRLGQITANGCGKPFIATDQQIISDYTDIGNFNPADPDHTDNGCDMETAANYGVSHGYADGSRDAGWITVDAADWNLVKLAFWLFENADLGMELPAQWLSNFPDKDGVVWDVAGDPDPSNGHNVAGGDVDTDGLWIDTWGLKLKLTKTALAKYAARSGNGELIIHVNQGQLIKGMLKAPNGVDWIRLLGYFDELGGHATIMPPVISLPEPTGPVTLGEAEGWMELAFKSGGLLMTRAHAQALAIAAMKQRWR